MNAAARKLATFDDLLAMPEEERRRYELIGGAIEPRGAASGRHGAAQRKLSAMVDPFERRPGGRSPGGWWFATEVDIFFDAQNTFRPDVVGWRRERVPTRPVEAVVAIRPDWVCEILSTNRRADLVTKKRVYHQYEVPYYWVVDPSEEVLSVNQWVPQGYMEILVAERGDVVRPQPFEAVELRIASLFGDDDEDEPAP